MSLNRKGTWLAAWVLVGLLTGGSASAQGLRDADPFAPAEPAHYGGGVRPNEGFFFSYDALYWSGSAPRRATFGLEPDLTNPKTVFWGPSDTQSITQGTTMDTSFMTSQFVPGQRIELGNIQEHTGWLFSYMLLHTNGNNQNLLGVQALFNDQQWGAVPIEHLTTDFGTGPLRALPVYFENVNIEMWNKLWGTEFNFLLRNHPGPRGGIFEWYFGARYVEFREAFNVNANGTPPATSLADTVFNTYATNNIFGPQVGLRWFKTNDRWQFSAESKFTAGWNSQNVRLDGFVGSDLSPTTFPRPAGWPLAMTPTSVDYASHVSVFSPVVELRIEGKYQLTKNIAFKAGWNGMYVGNLARPSGMVNYELAQTHVLGILSHNNDDRLFLQGVSIGIDVNR